MGFIRHDAIVVTSWSDADIEAAHARALTCFEETCAEVTNITGAAMNGYRSFLVAPDGSKEGWTDSDDAEDAREDFVAWLQEDGPLVSYIEVRFGGDEPDEASVRRPHDGDFTRVPQPQETP